MHRIAFFAFALCCWLSLTTAELGHFSAPAVLLATFVGGATLFFLTRLGRESRQSDPIRFWIVVFLAAFSCALTWPPGESILGAWDPGVYLHTGAAIVRGGGLPLEIPDLALLAPDERDILYRNYGGVWGPFSGMWLMADGNVSPQFFHLYPALLAVAWWFGGTWTALLVNPLLHAASVLTFYVFARRVLVSRWSIAATVFFAFCPAQLWQAQFSTAEMLAQLLLLNGAVFLAKSQESESRAGFEAFLAGAGFGLALLCRYDALMLVVPMVFIGIALWPQIPRKREAAITLAVVALLGVQAWLHQRAIAPFYHPMSTEVLGIIGVGGVLVLLHGALMRVEVWRSLTVSLSLKARTPLAGLLLFWAAYAALIRPFHEKSEDAANMLLLADVVGYLPLVIGFVGTALLIQRTESVWKRAWLYGSIAVLVVLVTRLYNDHFLMWSARRFVPVILPLLAIGCGMVFSNLASRNKAGLMLALALATACIGLNARSIATLSQRRDWHGLVAWYDKVNAALPQGATLVSDQPGFAAPLRFLYGHRAFELHDKGPGAYEKLARVFERWTGRGEKVWYLSMNAFPSGAGIRLTPRADLPLYSAMLEHAKRGVPRELKDRSGAFVLYEVESSKDWNSLPLEVPTSGNP